MFNNVHQFAAKEPSVVGVRQFFDDLCPRLFRLRGEQCRKWGGQYAFAFGDGKQYTLDFDNCRIHSRALRSAEVTIRGCATTFLGLLNGTEDVHRALASGDLSISGNRSLLKNLSEFTKPDPKQTKKENL